MFSFCERRVRAALPPDESWGDAAALSSKSRHCSIGLMKCLYGQCLAKTFNALIAPHGVTSVMFSLFRKLQPCISDPTASANFFESSTHPRCTLTNQPHCG